MGVFRPAVAAFGQALSSSGAYQRWRTSQAALPKFTKPQAYYTKVSSFSALCGNCPWFNPAGSTCVIVTEQGAPGAGLISPGGTCSLWGATPARIGMFRALYGRGPESGISPQLLRRQVEKYFYTKVDPEDVPEV